jgi:hypothetical protein
MTGMIALGECRKNPNKVSGGQIWALGLADGRGDRRSVVSFQFSVFGFQVGLMGRAVIIAHARPFRH